MPDVVLIEIARFSPESDQEPRFDTFEVPDRPDWMVLDALNYIKDEIDGSLTFRWSCRMGICGSCGMMINGREWLACERRVSDFASAGRVQVGPLRHFPLVRDLVIDMTDFIEKLAKVNPWLVRRDGMLPPHEEFLQTPAELEVYRQYSMCINCVLCFSACPVYGLDPAFAGPATIALAQRWNMDSRDQGASVRSDVLSQHDGIWDCVVIGECSVVCPKQVDPSLAIQQYKLTATRDWFRSFLPSRDKK
ncbi:MAG: succinate dehydrogenase iron-sulfur subunit [Candidatus Binataceae bacterium]